MEKPSMGEFRYHTIAHHQYHQHHQHLPELCYGWQTTLVFQIAQQPEISASCRKGACRTAMVAPT